ncbi:MAG: hypothetical protein JWP89_1503 [Schlesneria sp.]|nr:hypothetical protein [Schlesneria sp.]
MGRSVLVPHTSSDAALCLPDFREATKGRVIHVHSHSPVHTLVVFTGDRRPRCILGAEGGVLWNRRCSILCVVRGYLVQLEKTCLSGLRQCSASHQLRGYELH